MIKTQVTRLLDHIYRITVAPSEQFSFNHFLILDENPILIHTGRVLWFEHTLQGVGEVIDPQKITYITFSHFEADECGALNLWLEQATKATPIVGTVGQASIEDFSSVPCKVLGDGEKIHLGSCSLTLMETPHCPHNWDACMFYEPTHKILFCSDLGAQPGIPNGFIESEDAIDGIIGFQKQVGYMTVGLGLAKTLDRLESLDIHYLAIQHGSTLKGPVIKTLFKALRKEFC